jgi:hypothetical protein
MFVGALLMSAGGLAFVQSQTWVPPERAALSQIAGVLDSATKITTRAQNVFYGLEIKRADGGVVKLRLPAHQISEERVKNLVGQSVVVLFSDTQFVWELSSGGTTIIPYERTRRQDVEINASVAQVVPYVGGFGILLSLTGGLWLLRRRVAGAA